MKKLSVIASTAAAILLLSACGASNEAPASAEQPSATAPTESNKEGSSPEGVTESNDARESFEGGVFIGPDFTIKITDHKVIPKGAEGNEYGDKPVIAFWYEITNTSDDDVTPTDFVFVFKAIQDNNADSINELEVGGMPDDDFLDSQLEKIKKGGTVESAVAYELDDLETPVRLVASLDLGFTELGSEIYKLK